MSLLSSSLLSPLLMGTYEDAVRFASEGEFSDELSTARREYETRSGDLLDSDINYEQRIASFLEWYVLERPTRTRAKKTPIKLYLEARYSGLSTDELASLRVLTRTHYSVFEHRRSFRERFSLQDIFSKERFSLEAEEHVPGCDVGDLLLARIIVIDKKPTLFSSPGRLPLDAKKIVLKFAKEFKKHRDADRTQWVQQIDYFSNRSLRYGHLPIKTVFSELTVDRLASLST